MLDAEESEELRSLHARAYGRDSALTAAEAVRLRELEDRRRTTAAAPKSEEPTQVEEPTQLPHAAHVDGTDSVGPSPGERRDEPSPADRSGGEMSEPIAEAHASPGSSLRSLLVVTRSHWRPVAFATVAVLLVGLGVGWLAFGRSHDAPVALSPEQQQWEDDLVAGGDYDPGSVRALGVEEGAVIWTATKDGRERTCLILSTGDVTLPNCDETESVSAQGIYGSITVRSEEDLQRQISAQMLFTASGEPAVAVNSYDYDPTQTGITYANEEESQTAARLTREGFDAGSLWVVGYDGDVPLWTAVERDSQNSCLIYDGSTDDSPQTCLDPETMQEQGASLVLNVVDADSGAVTHFELASSTGAGYLVITHEADAAGAAED
ncbi:hypothetical protein [Microbacterium aurugineum]|uniref:Uncharacterized protein n=1 Tax=Microbacterium aurugineum TaxID=2851642 RepID=A0ABY4J3F4_9MICO|nr:hypothetical protein [Microbacterium aurugineum]UPL18506.1 hypothetical protein KV397_12435 [Microbacterium aurugineum]